MFQQFWITNPLHFVFLLLIIHLLSFIVMLGFPLASSRTSAKPKVFVIGLSKTGTTSLGDALERLNYTRSGWEDIWSRYLSRQALYPIPNLLPLISMAEQYQAFEDLPWALPQVYTEMSHRYPDSKFVLTLRRNETVWLESMRRHARTKLWEGHKTVYGGYQVDGNEEIFLKSYTDHLEEVRRFFESEEMKGRGMEMIIDDPNESSIEKWTRLARFLNIDVVGGVKTLGEFPKSNGNNLWSNSDPMGYVWFKYRLMFWVERGLIAILDGLEWCSSMMLS